MFPARCRKFSPAPFLLSLFAALNSAESKTVVVQNPWANDPAMSGFTIQLFGAGTSWNSSVSTAAQFHPAGKLWAFDFKSTPTGDFRLLNLATGWKEYGTGGIGNATSFNLDALFATNDTVWIIPDTTMANAVPKITTTRPGPVLKTMTILVQNPWESQAPGTAPSIQVESQGWKSLVPAGLAGWYATSATFANLTVGIRNAAGTSYFGNSGTTSSASTLALDTTVAKNDTVWISSATGKTIVGSVAPPVPPVARLMVFNPWDGVFPLSRPVAYVDGSAAGVAMSPSTGYCGWYEVALTSVPSTLLLKASGTGQSFGSTGKGGTSAFSVVVAATNKDTIWVATNSGAPASSRAFPGGVGTCLQAVLATTVHDMDQDAPGFGLLFPTPLKGQIKGLVQDTLDAARKPVLRDPNWNDSTLYKWFKDVPGWSASTCRDLTLALDTATGVYSMADSAFFPIDDFTTLPGGAPNPYNSMLLATNPYPHDFSFCLETHGEFEYRKLQTLQFTGDDDLWYFVDGRLKVDLGGVHYAMSGGVGLDTLGLVVGKTYPWDLFFCERIPYGSSFRLTTSMNLRTEPKYQFQASAPGAKIRRIQLYSTVSVGQGCNASLVQAPARGLVQLQGGTLPGWTALAPGLQHGGISVGDSSWQVGLDTSAIRGLPPGSYVLRIRVAADTSRYQDLSFTVAAPPPPVVHVVTPGSRCDLLSAPVKDTSACIDVGALDGDTLRVPGATTRLSSQGLVLCGTKGDTAEGTDIVYIIDQSGSMDGSYLVIKGVDTMNFYTCRSWASGGVVYPSGIATTISYRGDPTMRLFPSTEYDSVVKYCTPSGDPYAARAKVVQAAIQQQALMSPSSRAGWISFGSGYHSSGLFDLSDPAARDSLVAQVLLEKLGGTAYAEPIGWARALLQGATSTFATTPPSPNRRKAIIMISDGAPADSAETMDVLQPLATFEDTYGTDWTLPNDTAPPIYGFMLSSASASGKTLKTLADSTGGGYYMIPPLDRDSLKRVMNRVLGSIIQSSRPDSLKITNVTNGQVSKGISGGAEAGGYRFRLDSLVGLMPGTNVLELRSVLTGARDSVVKVKWTVIVGDSGASFATTGKDSLLMASCWAPTRLSVRPLLDTARMFADERDSLLKFSLDVRYDNQLNLPVGFTTVLSRDTGTKTLRGAKAPTDPRLGVAGSDPWRMNLSAVRTDTVVQTGYGWDTLKAVFRMPRDKRDTAVAILPLRHFWPATVAFSVDTALGVAGSLGLVVRDTNTVSDTVRVKVFHRLGDTVSVLLRRDSGIVFKGSFPFVQGANPVRGDSILQTGTVRTAPFDSVYALYSGLYRDTSILRRAPPRLRFLDGAGKPVDTVPGSSLDMGGSASYRIGLFVDDQLLSQTDSVVFQGSSFLSMHATSTGPSIAGLRLVAGIATVWVRGDQPGSGGSVRMNILGRDDSLVYKPVEVRPYRLRFLLADGTVVDSLQIDQDVLTSARIRVQVWGSAGACSTCDGFVRSSTISNALSLRDTTGQGIDSFRISKGVGTFLVHGAKPVVGAKVALVPGPAFASDLSLAATFRPYRIRFVDAGGAVSDSLAVDQDVLTTARVRVQIWGRDGICLSCTGGADLTGASASVELRDTTGKIATKVFFRNGEGYVAIRGLSPVSGASVGIRFDSLSASGNVSPISFRAYRVRFADASGGVSDTLSIDQDVFALSTVRVQIWGRDGICTTCQGAAALAPSDTQIHLVDGTGKRLDSVGLRNGQGQFWLSGNVPLSGGKVVVKAGAFFATGAVSPISFRPYVIKFFGTGGALQDSMGLTASVRTGSLVGIQVWGGQGWCSSCQGVLSLVPSDPHLVVADSSGTSAKVVLRGGVAWFRVRSDWPVANATLAISFDSLYARTSLQPIRITAPPPDSAVYGDLDGDGALDVVHVYFRNPWYPTNTLGLPWPDAGTLLDLSQATLQVSADSTRLDFTFAKPQSPRTTAWTSGPVRGSWAWSKADASESFPVIERIPPIPTRARIARGTGWDTLVVTASEALDDSSVRSGGDLVRRVAGGAMPTERVSWDPRTKELRLVYSADSIDALVRPGDSVRFAAGGGVRDLLLDAPGAVAPAVVVEGLDHGPYLAEVLDVDVDGRADRVVLHFAVAPRVEDLFRFGWPDRQGNIQMRTATLADAKSDSSGRILSFSVAPFEFGATSCPDGGCKALAGMGTRRWGDSLWAAFDEVDRVAPVIVSGQLRFGSSAGVADTVRAILSEPVVASPGGSWLRWGRPGSDSLGAEVGEYRAIQVQPNVFELLVDSTFLASSKDSLRLGAYPGGGVRDSAGNAPQRVAYWAPLQLGPIPVRLMAKAWPALVNYTNWAVPPQEQPLSVFVRATPGDPWRTLDGGSPLQEQGHYTGILIKTNRDMDVAAVYLYDNLGVSVARIDLAPLQQAIRDGSVNTALRGDFEAWVAWDGRSVGGAMATSGIYLARVMAWKNDNGKRVLVNGLFKLGWHAAIAPDWDENDMPNW